MIIDLYFDAKDVYKRQVHKTFLRKYRRHAVVIIVIASAIITPTGDVYKRQLWHSAMHHGSFSSVSAEETLSGINGRLKSAHERLDRLDCLLLTFGSAWVYENKKTGTIAVSYTHLDVYKRQLLNGKWGAIVDLYDQGERMQVYKNRKPQDNKQFYEYSFDGGLGCNHLKYIYAAAADAKRTAAFGEPAAQNGASV